MYSTFATVLRTQSFREQDRLITVYTKGFGKLTLLGRGMQKIQSKLAGHLQEFALSSIVYVRGRRFETITDAKLEHVSGRIRNDLPTLAVGSLILEYYHHWTKEALPDYALWDLLMGTFNALEEGVHPLVIRWAFPLRFLGTLGWQLRLDRCFKCLRSADEMAHATIDVGHGGVYCEQCNLGQQRMSITQTQLQLLIAFQTAPYEMLTTIPAEVASLEPMIRAYADFYRDWESRAEHWGRWIYNDREKLKAKNLK